MRGWEAVRSLKTDPDTCAIPLVTCSWFGESEEAHALAGQADGRLSQLELYYDDFVSTLRKAGVEL